MAFCLPKKHANAFKQALKDGKIVPENLFEMSSEERRKFFEPIVGESAKEVNSMLESKLILKDQKTGLVNWAKKLTGITEARRTDIISRIEALNKVLDTQDKQSFLEDLASSKLGGDVTFEEAKQITQSVKEVQELKAKIAENSPKGSQ